MDITIIKPDAFRMHKNVIGIILYSNAKMSNFFVPGGEHKRLATKDLSTIRLDFLEEELEENIDLREFAKYHELIEVHDFDKIDYLKYINSFNI